MWRVRQGDVVEPAWFPVAFGGTIAYGCCYFPMSVLAAQTFGSVWAALPHIVFLGIMRALPSYMLTVVALAVASIVSIYARDFADKIPYIGWLLATAVGLYAMMFQGRLIGAIYVDKQEVLGWG